MSKTLKLLKVPRKTRGKINPHTTTTVPELVQQAAFEMYLQRVDGGFKTMAEKFGVTFDALRHIAEVQDWPSKRAEIEAVMRQKFERELAHVLMQERSKIVGRHTKLTELIDGAILARLVNKDGTLKKKIAVTTLESLTKSLKSSADVAARAVGLDKVVMHKHLLVQPGVKGRRLEQKNPEGIAALPSGSPDA